MPNEVSISPGRRPSGAIVPQCKGLSPPFFGSVPRKKLPFLSSWGNLLLGKPELTPKSPEFIVLVLAVVYIPPITPDFEFVSFPPHIHSSHHDETNCATAW